MVSYDLLVYNEFTDDSSVASTMPVIGTPAAGRFGDEYEGLFVTAIGPGIHDGRVTVVLSDESGPEQQQQLKDFFKSWGRVNAE